VTKDKMENQLFLVLSEFVSFKLRTDGKIMYRKDGKAIVVPEGYPIYLQENSRKCYTLKTTSHYCIDGAAEYGNPNPFNNDEGEIFLVTCSEFLIDPPVSKARKKKKLPFFSLLFFCCLICISIRLPLFTFKSQKMDVRSDKKKLRLKKNICQRYTFFFRGVFILLKRDYCQNNL